MYHHYETMYKLSIHHKAQPENKDEHYIPIYFNVEEMFVLFDTILGGYDGWRQDDNTLKSVVIHPSKWGHIALMSNPKNETLQKLIGAGAELVEKTELFKDVIDAGIQMAFIAAKADIKSKDILEATNGNITEYGYKKLQEIFYDDYPEKFI